MNVISNQTRKKPLAIRAIKDIFPFALSAFPFGVVMGVTAYGFALEAKEFLYMNLTINAGASQLAFVDQFADKINPIVIILSCSLINCRMFLYSLSLQEDFKTLPLIKRLLVSFFVIDQSYACYEIHKDSLKDEQEQFTYFISAGITLILFWQTGSMIGFFAGDILPFKEHLDFLVPLAFIGIFGPKLKDKTNLLVFFIAVFLSVIFYHFPLNLGLMASSLSAMAIGVALKKRRLRL
jgi:4-azaleucine resistance transporter AzlC